MVRQRLGDLDIVALDSVFQVTCFLLIVVCVFFCLGGGGAVRPAIFNKLFVRVLRFRYPRPYYGALLLMEPEVSPLSLRHGVHTSCRRLRKTWSQTCTM
jgi:hypothetical protein